MTSTPTTYQIFLFMWPIKLYSNDWSQITVFSCILQTDRLENYNIFRDVLASKQNCRGSDLGASSLYLSANMSPCEQSPKTECLHPPSAQICLQICTANLTDNQSANIQTLQGHAFMCKTKVSECRECSWVWREFTMKVFAIKRDHEHIFFLYL